MLINNDLIDREITAVCEQYEDSAPTVHAWADDLYRRFNSNRSQVVLTELDMLTRLFSDGQWMQPNYAANAVYHMLHRLGRDVTGQVGF